MRRPSRRSKRSAELMRVAALDTDSSFCAGRRQRGAERTLEALCGARHRDLRCRPGGSPSPTGSRACAASPPRPARRPARGRRARAGRGRGRGRVIGSAKTRGATFDAVARTEPARPLSSPRMGTASRTTAAPATMPHSRVLPAVATVVGVAVLLRLVYEPWFLNYDARYALVWARDIATRADAGLQRPLRAHAAPARDAGLARRGAVRRGRRLDHGVGRPALLRRARLARLPARRGAVLAGGRAS